MCARVRVSATLEVITIRLSRTETWQTNEWTPGEKKGMQRKLWLHFDCSKVRGLNQRDLLFVAKNEPKEKDFLSAGTHTHTHVEVDTHLCEFEKVAGWIYIHGYTLIATLFSGAHVHFPSLPYSHRYTEFIPTIVERKSLHYYFIAAIETISNKFGNWARVRRHRANWYGLHEALGWQQLYD